MTIKSRHNHTSNDPQALRNMSLSAFSHTGNMNAAILDEMLNNFDQTLETIRRTEEFIDDTFNKTDYDIQVEADEFLQTRVPQYSERHPHE